MFNFFKKKKVDFYQYLQDHLSNIEEIASSYASTEQYVIDTVEIARNESEAFEKLGFYVLGGDACLRCMIKDLQSADFNQAANLGNNLVSEIMNLCMDSDVSIPDELVGMSALFSLFTFNSNECSTEQIVEKLGISHSLWPEKWNNTLEFYNTDALIASYCFFKESVFKSYSDYFFDNNEFEALTIILPMLESTPTDNARMHAWFMYSILYRNGLGVERSIPKYIKYTKDIVNAYPLDLDFDISINSHAVWLLGLENLGYAYATGEGLVIDYNKAAMYISKAVELGSPNACVKLGELHLKGRGVPQDNKLAMKYFNKAAEEGVEEAISFIDFLNGRTTVLPGEV